MDDKNKQSDYKPDITNYDYVWGSDQDEYIKKDKPAIESSTAEKENEEIQ
ncbi:hypothetical protein FHS15_000554 [Paenibacillus castaneae]|nr:hypothetical protein [Paenibacillus castaneae]NIK75454.1 hypothetical protein [Paenibacillus castaneae]